MPWDLVSQPLQGSREVGQDKAGPDIPIYSCDPLDPRPPPAPAVLAALASPTEQPEIAVLETPLPAAVCLPLLGGLLRRQRSTATSALRPLLLTRGLLAPEPGFSVP